jgi:hypothetical protein
MTLRYYKIRKKSDPTQFRKADGTWNQSGKVYDTIGKLRSVLTYTLNNPYSSNRLDDWEIVEFEVVQREVHQVNDMIRPEQLVKLLKR